MHSGAMFGNALCILGLAAIMAPVFAAEGMSDLDAALVNGRFLPEAAKQVGVECANAVPAGCIQPAG